MTDGKISQQEFLSISHCPARIPQAPGTPKDPQHKSVYDVINAPLHQSDLIKQKNCEGINRIPQYW